MSWRDQNRTQCSRCDLTKAKYGGIVAPLDLLVVLLVMQPRMWFAFIVARPCCWLMLSWLSTRISMSFSAELHSSHSAPSAFCCLGLFYATCSTSCLSFVKTCDSCLPNLSAYQSLFVGWFFILVYLFLLQFWCQTKPVRLRLNMSCVSFINTWSDIILHGTSLAICCQFIFTFCYLRPVFIKHYKTKWTLLQC